MADAPPTSPSSAATFGAHDPASTSCTCNCYISDIRHRPATAATMSPNVVDPDVIDIPITEESQPLTSFTLFPNLPQEMRDHIWGFASFLPRDVPVFTAAVSGYPVVDRSSGCVAGLKLPHYQIISSQPAPPILHVSREARLEGLKHYKLIFKTHYIVDDVRHEEPPRMYFNTEADRLCVFGPLPADVYDRIAKGIVSEGIRKVAVNNDVFWGSDPHNYIRVNGLDHFLSPHMRKKWLDLNIKEVVYYFSPRFIQRSDKIRFVEADETMEGMYETEHYRLEDSMYLKKLRIHECQKRWAKSGKVAEEPVTDAELESMLDKISGPILRIMKLEVTEGDWRRYPETSWRS